MQQVALTQEFSAEATRRIFASEPAWLRNAFEDKEHSFPAGGQ